MESKAQTLKVLAVGAVGPSTSQGIPSPINVMVHYGRMRVQPSVHEVIELWGEL